MELVVEPAIEMTQAEDLAADIVQNTRRVVSYLERFVRRYPDQWNWLAARRSKNNFVSL